MSGFEVNKILATIILALLVFIVIDHIGDALVDPEIPEKQAYIIEVPEGDSDQISENSMAKEEEIIESILPLLAAASLEKGKKISKKCVSCHTFKKGEAHRIGPNLYGIIGASVGIKEGYAYSKAMSSFGGNWNYEVISEFLYKPKKYVKGTKMNFIGLGKIQDRANLIMWLRENADNPMPLP